MSKYIPNAKQAQKSQWMWSSKPYSKAEREKEERENKEYRDKLEAVKNRIESIPLEQLSFRDLYTEPFIKDKIIGWVYSGDNFIFQFLGDNEDTNNKCLQILNDEITEYNRQDVKHLNGEITVNDVPFILIRGWGNLTSSGGYNLDGDYACKIQDTLAEYIVEKLNFAEKTKKEEYSNTQKKSLEANKQFIKNTSPEKLEELMKEFDNYETETLEETAEKYANEWEETYPELDPENMTPIEISKIDFIAGVKLQQKRSYSKEEVINALHSVELKDNKDYSKIYKDMEKWLEQNKKK